MQETHLHFLVRALNLIKRFTKFLQVNMEISQNISPLVFQILFHLFAFEIHKLLFEVILKHLNRHTFIQSSSSWAKYFSNMS